MKRVFFFRMAVALMLAGCAAAPPAIEKPDVAPPAVEAKEQAPAAPSRLFDERDLLLAGVEFLGRQERTESAKARSVFLSLVQRYPRGRWRPAAEAFIRLIDEKDALREAGRRDQLLLDEARAEQAKVLHENEGLKKTVRELMERLQTEKASLTQENEQLKKDIQRLKALEIELEKRERMLR